MDGLVAMHFAARFPGWRLLGLLSNARRSTEYAGGRREDPPLRAALPVARRHPRRSPVPTRRPPLARRYSRRDEPLPVFQHRHCAPQCPPRRALVSHASRARSLPNPCHGPVWGAVWAVGILKEGTQWSVAGLTWG